MQFATKYTGTISVIWDGEQIVQVTLGIGTGWQKTITRSYLEDGQIIFSREDAPSGTILALNRQELEEVALMGGSVMLYADDLYRITVLPEWWSIECQMATEGECPPWPLVEEVTEGNDLGQVIINRIREIISREDDEDWD